MDLFKLLGTVSVDTGEANKALDETGQKGKNAEGTLGKVFGGIGKGALAVGKAVGAGMVAAGTAVAGLATKSIQAYADYEQLVGGVETLFGTGGKSIEEYAESVGKTVEQCKGEYNKLMKSQETVLENAKNGYKTAGLSANAYMETVTSFSASLLQSLGGDTVKAAEYADRAIIDMADNANKMGTDMSMIQNAYQGFAKQNYTMLDNLKLGYGGTKEEMARLIEDASQLTDVQKELGVTVDANDMSFGNIVNAISVMQSKMGIAGTTAKEAATTITGSTNMMKAAWTNLLTAISDDNADFDSYVTAFVDSVGAVAENLMPRIEIALNGVIKLVDKLAPVIMSKIPELLSTLLPSIVEGATSLMQSLVDIIPGLVSTFTSLLPEVVNGFIAIVEGLFSGLDKLAWGAAPELINGIADAFELLIGELPLILDRILSAITGLLPSLVTGIVSVIATLASELPNILEQLVIYVPWILELIVEALLDNLPMLINGIVTMLTGIIEYLPAIIETLLTMITSIFTMLVEQLPVILPVLLEAVISLITLLIDQLPVILPMIVEAVLTIITLLQEQLPVLIPMLVEAVIAIINIIIEQLPVIMPMIIEACITIIMAIIEALPDILTALVDALPGLLQAVWDAIVMVFENLPQWFEQLWQGVVDIIMLIWEPIEPYFSDAWEAIKAVWSAVTGFFSDIWEDVKEVFDPVVEFFSIMFDNAWQAVSAIWTGLSSLFSGIWQAVKIVLRPVTDFFRNIFQTAWNTVKNIFSPVANFFRNAFNGAWNAIKNIFSNVRSFFGGIWNNIKTTFSGLGSKIGDAISGAVKSGINGLIGSAESVINGFLGMINNAIGLINKIPGVNISKVKLVSFTRLAEGGVVDEPTPAVFGEDGAEAVVPLEKNTGWISKVAEQLHRFTVENKNDLSNALSRKTVELQEQQVSEMQTLNKKIDRIISLLVEFFPELLEALNINMYLDTGVLVAETAPAMDAELGRIAIRKGRGR
jgi:phage-related protein